MRGASRKAYGSNSFFQSYIKILYHQQDFYIHLYTFAAWTVNQACWDNLKYLRVDLFALMLTEFLRARELCAHYGDQLDLLFHQTQLSV